MKFVKFAILALLLPVIFFSCSKDNNHDVALPVEGSWNGLYGYDNDPPFISYKLNVKHGGVIEELNVSGNVKGSGNWNLSGNTFTGHYQWKAPMNTVFSITATYDPATKKLTGTWGFDDSSTDGGKWEAIKSN
jgi:hypothetical protein